MKVIFKLIHSIPFGSSRFMSRLFWSSPIQSKFTGEGVMKIIFRLIESIIVGSVRIWSCHVPSNLVSSGRIKSNPIHFSLQGRVS